jgi:NAD(P)H-nitrite reductase large subunit
VLSTVLTETYPSNSHTTMAIICHCEVVRERTIQKAIRRGATTLEAVQAECGAAVRCGGCEPAVRALIGEACHADATYRHESVVAVAL